MLQSRWWVVLVISMASASPSHAIINVFKICGRDQVKDLNKSLSGQVLDFTANHREDHRIYSKALGSKRDLYVYLPCGYDGQTQFPLMYWLHGFGQDEKNFLDIVPHMDKLMRCGQIPRMIIACPDGSVTGRPSLFNAGSFYLNSRSGQFEDWVMQDVWCFLTRHFAINPARGAHVIAGGSMGGFAAYNLGFKYRDRFGTIVGAMPGLSLRYADCHGNYFGAYDPNCVMFREKSRPHMIIGRFYEVVLIREKRMTRPLVDRTHQAMDEIAKQNPIEMLDTFAIKPGEFNMFVGYAGKDEFNLNAQALHFLDYAASRGLEVTSKCIPDGEHNTETGIRLLPSIGTFLMKHVGPYAPPLPTAGVSVVPAMPTVPSPAPMGTP